MMHQKPIYDENTKDESPQKSGSAQTTQQGFLIFHHNITVWAFLLSTKQDTEHMHSCHSGYNMEKVKLRFCCLTITKKKMSQRKGWIFKHIKKTRHCYIIEKWPFWYSFASLTWSFYLLLFTNNNPLRKGDFPQNHEISVGIWKSASEFSSFYLGE